MHTKDSKYVNNLIEKTKKHWKNPKGSFKKISQRVTKSQYIYKEDLKKVIRNKKDFNIRNITKVVESFYNKVNKIIKVYDK